MYFAIGGRKVQSGLYRVTYTGSESTEPVTDVTPRAGSRHSKVARGVPRQGRSVCRRRCLEVARPSRPRDSCGRPDGAGKPAGRELAGEGPRGDRSAGVADGGSSA